MENVLKVLNEMVEEQKQIREELIKHIDHVNKKFDEHYRKVANGIDDSAFDTDVWNEALDELYNDVSRVNYAIRMLKRKINLVEVENL